MIELETMYRYLLVYFKLQICIKRKNYTRYATKLILYLNACPTINYQQKAKCYNAWFSGMFSPLQWRIPQTKFATNMTVNREEAMCMLSQISTLRSLWKIWDTKEDKGKSMMHDLIVCT